MAQRPGSAAVSRLTLFRRAEEGPRLCPVRLQHFQLLTRLQVALAAKPVLHGRLKAREWHARSGFEHSVGQGQRVVEDRIVGEVAHGKVVDPANWARVPRAAHIDPLNGKPACEHPSNLMDARPAGVHPACQPGDGYLTPATFAPFPCSASTWKRL